ncbi:MAG: peptidoglycan-binding protein, partial [Planctomycetales bacterium]|nr:peptidoglycan-binding protein [Planctomycetales bacterium]
MNSISQPIGRGVSNLNRNDVQLVQRLLNRHRLQTSAAIQEDGLVGPKTIAAIEEFQKRVVRMSMPDGRVDPGGATFRALSNTSTSPVAPSSPAGSTTVVYKDTLSSNE